MSLDDELRALRAQLTRVESEAAAQEALSAARSAFRAAPDDPAAKDAAQAAAQRLRALRAEQRGHRRAPASGISAVVRPEPVAATAATPLVV